jgi:hypothetical protein
MLSYWRLVLQLCAGLDRFEGVVRYGGVPDKESFEIKFKSPSSSEFFLSD